MTLKIIFSIIFMYSSLVLGSVNYHGRIINQSSGNPLTLPNVRFNIKIKAGSSCIIYEENHDNINMSGSNGYFSHNIGEGSVVFGSFDNSMKIDGTSVACSGGGTESLTSVIAKSIDVQILEFDGTNYSINVSQVVGLQIKDIPVAIEAKSLSGKTASSFIQVSGSVTQTALEDLVLGNSLIYVLSSNLASEVSTLTSGKLNTALNLSDVPDKASARSNLGLGSLAIQNSVSDSDISSLSYSKLTGTPLDFPPSAHGHSISDITNLETSLNSKVSNSQLNLNCSSAQTIQYISISDSYQCQNILISSSQISGLGSSSLIDVGTGANQILQLDSSGKIPSSTIPSNILTDSTSFAGDISGSSSSITVDQIKNIPVSSTNPTAGQVLVYNGTQWVPSSGFPVFVRKASDQTFGATAFSNDSALLFNVSANATYKFKFMILYTSAATTTGLRVSLTFPTVNIESALAQVSLGGDGTGAFFNGVINSSGDSVQATGTPTAAPNVNMAIIQGIISPSANGTVQLRIASEIAGSNIIIKAGSLLEYTLIP